MLVADKKEFTVGLLMSLSFLIVLGVMFTPLFDGRTAFRAADRLFNSISKGSAYYIPQLVEKTEPYKGRPLEMTLKLENADLAAKAAKVLQLNGAEVEQTDNGIKIVKGDLGVLVAASLKDSDAMYYNRGEEVSTRYGFNEREVLYTWWSLYKQLIKSLKEEKRFEGAAFVEEINAKGIEVGYNYYKIQPESAKSKWPILSFSLVFYVVYTMWWGFAIFFMFEGVGLKMKAGAKKEV